MDDVWLAAWAFMAGVATVKLFDVGFEKAWEGVGKFIEKGATAAQVERKSWAEIRRIEAWALREAAKESWKARGLERMRVQSVKDLLAAIEGIEGRLAIESKTVSILKKWDLETYREKLNHARMIIGHIEREHPFVISGLFERGTSDE